MNQDDLNTVNKMLNRWDELSDSINLISGPAILMAEKQYQQTENRLNEMKAEKSKIRDTIKGFIAGRRTDFWD